MYDYQYKYNIFYRNHYIISMNINNTYLVYTTRSNAAVEACERKFRAAGSHIFYATVYAGTQQKADLRLLC